MKKHYVVTVVATVPVDTTVAVTAASQEEATRMALDGVSDDPTEWLNYGVFVTVPTVSDVREEKWDELQCADQKHLLGQP